MKIQFAKYVSIAITGIILFYSCSKDDSSDSVTPVTPSSNPLRDAALADYNSNYLGSIVSSTGWTGNTSTCSAGTVSQTTHNAVIKRINYFRRMVGLNDQCTLDTTLFAQQQETALIMSANNALNHNPPNTWLCWTSTAAAGAGSSNLALGSNPSAAVSAFIQDNGTGNQVVGHRRWILHSRKQEFSYGSTNNAMALYVFNSDTNTVVPDFIAYPPKGYVPQSLVYSRWSLGIPGAGFGGATVSMTGPGGTSVPSTIVSSTDNGYGDNTLVWEPTGIITTSTADISYTVTVSGITGADSTSYTYTVNLFKP